MQIPSQIPSYALLLGNIDISFPLSLLAMILWHVSSLQQFALAFDRLKVFQRLYLYKILSQHQTQIPTGFLTTQHTVEGESKVVHGSGSQTWSTMPPLCLPAATGVPHHRWSPQASSGTVPCAQEL